MRYRLLGRTDLRVSEIAFGTGDTAGALVYGTPAEQRRIVLRALDAGVNYFDLSPDYGKGLAEVNLGRVLSELGNEEVAIATKVEVMPEHFAMIHRRVSESVNDSLTRLRRDRLDVVLLHNPCRPHRNPKVRLPWTPLEPADVLGDVIAAFESLRDAGKVAYFGLACERAEVGAVTQVVERAAIDMIYVWFNLANPSAAMDQAIAGLPEEEDYNGLFGVAEDLGIGIGVIRPLAGGALTSAILERGSAGRHRLSGGVYSWWPELLAPEIERARRFAFLDRPGYQTLSEAAFRFILGHPAVTTVIGGFSDVEHLDEAATASERGALSDDDLGRIRRVYEEGFSRPASPSPPMYSSDSLGLVQ